MIEHSQPRAFQALAISRALKFTAETGMMVNSSYTMKNMLATAKHILGREYTRKECLQAAADLRDWAHGLTFNWTYFSTKVSGTIHLPQSRLSRYFSPEEVHNLRRGESVQNDFGICTGVSV